MFADSSTHHPACHPVSMSNVFAVRRGAVSYNLAVAKGTDGNSKGRGRKTASAKESSLLGLSRSLWKP